MAQTYFTKRVAVMTSFIKIICCFIINVPIVLAISGCTMRGVDTTLTPQLLADGQVVYVYSDLANFAQPDQDAEAEKLRVRDLNDWVNDSGVCPNGYEVIKRLPVSVRSNWQAKKVYYFIKCRT